MGIAICGGDNLLILRLGPVARSDAGTLQIQERRKIGGGSGTDHFVFAVSVKRWLWLELRVAFHKQLSVGASHVVGFQVLG